MKDLPDSPEERVKQLQSSKELKTLVYNKIIETLIETPSKEETPEEALAILSGIRALAKLPYNKKEKQSDKPVTLDL